MDIPCILSNYYKGHVWSLNGEKYEGLVWIEENTLPKPTLEELTEKWNEHLAAQPLKELRQERNRRLAEVDWIFSSDYRVDTDLYQGWLGYRKALRDLPSTVKDPKKPIWPEKPATATGQTADYYERDTQSTKIILLQNVVNSLLKRIENLENP